MTGQEERATLAAAVEAWIAFFEGLTPDSLETRLAALAAPDIRFRDPFNDVRGVEALRTIFRHMFATTEDSRFTVTDRALSGRTAYLRWVYTFRPKGSTAPWRIEGMSEVHIAPDGRIAAHLDYWDSGTDFYAKLPVIGWVIRRIRKKMGVAG